MRELNSILRTAAVQSAAARQLENSSRVNISGIAAITGIPRAEVSRILKSSEHNSVQTILGRQSVTSRVLSAWHGDPHYLTVNRRARELKVFGSGRTFESLVEKYGQGIPVRAILDELKRAGAIQLRTSPQRVFPRLPLAISPRITYKKLKDFNAATADLFHGFLSPSNSSFVDVSGIKVWSGRAIPVRKRLGANAISLLRELQTKLGVNDTNHGLKQAQKVAQLSMRIVYRERNVQLEKQPLKSRRNLHRSR